MRWKRKVHAAHGREVTHLAKQGVPAGLGEVIPIQVPLVGAQRCRRLHDESEVPHQATGFLRDGHGVDLSRRLEVVETSHILEHGPDHDVRSLAAPKALGLEHDDTTQVEPWAPRCLRPSAYVFTSQLVIAHPPRDELVHEARAQRQDTEAGAEPILRVHDLDEGKGIPDAPLLRDVMTYVRLSI